jgi:hypothetical protein
MQLQRVIEQIVEEIQLGVQRLMFELIQWLLMASEIRRRIEQLAGSVSYLDAEVDFWRRRQHHEVN